MVKKIQNPDFGGLGVKQQTHIFFMNGLKGIFLETISNVNYVS